MATRPRKTTLGSPTSRVARYLRWRQYLVETLLCFVLLGVVGKAAISDATLWSGPAIATSVAAILNIVRRAD